MRKTLYIRAIALLACLSIAGPAYAFKEMPVENAAPPAAAAPVEAPTAMEKAKKALSLSGDENNPAADKKGIELKIPGVGTLGTLPKLDFGLELLYGATEKDLPQNESDELDPTDDMTIRGTLKHRF